MRWLPLLLIPLVAVAQDKKPDAKKLERIAISDPAKLKNDLDFAWSGEYLQIPKSARSELSRIGTEVISRGGGEFEIVTFDGGLPGLDDNARRNKSNSGKMNEGVVTLRNNKGTYSLSNGKLDFMLNGRTAPSNRMYRESPTLGAKPPANAIVLFDKPEDLKNWTGMKTVKLSDGEFRGVGGRTKQKFQSFTLHLEFRLPWMPNSTGQARGNSGVYLQDRYEIQVLDSFGLAGKDNECGGIYKESAPKVNMCFPPMTWQTYDIDFTAAQFADGKKVKPAVVTVKHNGVVIHDKLELKNNTPGGGITKEIPEPGAIFLQNHSDPVVYRNVWIVEKK